MLPSNTSLLTRPSVITKESTGSSKLHSQQYHNKGRDKQLVRQVESGTHEEDEDDLASEWEELNLLCAQYSNGLATATP